MTKSKHQSHEKEHAHKKSHKEEKKSYAYIWKTLTLAFLIWALAASYFALTSSGVKESKNKTITQTLQACSQANVQKAIDFINQNLVRPGTKASIMNYSSENICWITTEYQGNKIPVMLKEGNILVLPYNVVNIEETEKRIEEQKKKMEQSINKTEKPEVKLFIMSFCPYGRQAAQAMLPVYRLLKDKAEINVHYVIYPSDYYKGRENQYCIDNYCSMHGIKETVEDVREICMAKIYGWDKFWDYMEIQLKDCSLSNIDTCWKSVAQKVGIDVDKIEACVKANATTYLKQEYQLNKRYGVRGSPTLFINNALYSGERTSEAFKQTICKAFVKPPEECSQSLSQQTTTPKGSCGG